MIYTMSDSGQLEGLSGGKCSSSQTETALLSLVTNFSALFRTPSLHGPKLDGGVVEGAVIARPVRSATSAP
jgi:hypothetical protein